MNTFLWILAQTTIPEQPLQMIERYGVMAVVLLVTGLLAFFLIKYILNSNKKQEQNLANLQQQILDLYKKSIDDKKDEKDLTGDKLERFAESANKVQVLTYHLLTELDFSRICVYEYHNGGKTVTGVDFKKCSATYEAVQLGIDNRSRTHQNIPISTNLLWSKLLLDKCMICIQNIEDIKNVDSTVYKILSSENVLSYYSILIKDYDDTPIGFMTLESIGNTVILNDEKVQIIKDSVIKIAGLIQKH